MLEEKEKILEPSLSEPEETEPEERRRAGQFLKTGSSLTETGGEAGAGASCRKVPGCGHQSLLKFSSGSLVPSVVSQGPGEKGVGD